MNEPSDPQRPTGDDRPRETAAFEDTEFSFGDAATRSGFTADVVENEDDAGNTTDGSVVDADVVGEEALGHTSDPEMTGIIPAIRDDSPRPADLAAPAAAVETPAETATGGDDDRSGFRRIPSWAWILIVGAILAVVVGLVAAALMRGNESSGPTPLTSVEPNYERPEAWNGDVSAPSADVPTGGQNYGYDPYSDGTGGQSWDSGTTDDGSGTGDDEDAAPTDTTDDGAGNTVVPDPGTGTGEDSGESGTPGTGTPGGDTGTPGGDTGDTGDAGDTGDTAGETTE
ncbi:hypothetical protein [Corynebacterium variabile]|uniref:hypothetical protein n=1 Tax=Corynebacterium variabile TaxID=1727 RepID=UPI003A917AE9